MFFGYDLNRVEDIPDGARHASYAHIAIHLTVIAVLEVVKWWIHFKGWFKNILALEKP